MIGSLVALTTYYNPLRGERRRRNYQVFRAHVGVPLVTVEWSREGDFELAPGDAEVLLRVSGGDLLWQKERMLNIGLAHIREQRLADDVAMLDADVVFEDADWPQRVRAALDAHPLAQCHSHVTYLARQPVWPATRAALLQLRAEATAPSQASALASGKPLYADNPALAAVFATLLTPATGHPGMTTAIRVSRMPAFRFYENNIVGAGDSVLVAAASGRLDELFGNRPYAKRHEEDIRAWAAHCVGSGALGLGVAHNGILHLWHGEPGHRQYTQRLQILASHDYDPARDVDGSGPALRCTPAARGLGDAIAAYLVSRNDA